MGYPRGTYDIAVTRCADCRAAEGPLVPEHVNVAQEYVVLMVARAFADAVRGASTTDEDHAGPYRTPGAR